LLLTVLWSKVTSPNEGDTSEQVQANLLRKSISRNTTHPPS